MVVDGVHLDAAAAVEEIVALRVRHQLQLTCGTQAVHWLKQGAGEEKAAAKQNLIMSSRM